MRPAPGFQVPRRRVTIYLAVLLGSIFAFTVGYWFGMAAFEEKQVTLLHSLQVVVETYTTAGYGSDAPWESPEMNLFVVAMNAFSLVLIFLALPVFLTPLLRDAIRQTAPTSLDRDLSDHVVLASKSPRMDSLTEVLRARDVEYVVVEPDEETATELYEAGETVLHGSPAERAPLEAAGLRDARALVVDVEEENTDASVVLAARELDEDVRVVSVANAPERAPYHRLAGADDVIALQPTVGQRLAEMATAAVRTDLGEDVELGEEFRIAELPIARAGDLAGNTVEQAGLEEDPGVDLAALWHDGEFESPVPPDRMLSAGTVLIAVGTETALADLAEYATGRPRSATSGETVVIGHGDVGRAVTETLDDLDLPYTVVDLRDGPSVDVVGDATDPEVLEEAGVGDADAVVIAIPDDAETEFVTLVTRDVGESVHVAARADDEGSVSRLYRAGADYVLAVNAVTGRLLGAAVLDEDVVLAADARIEVVEIGADGLAGTTLSDDDGAEIAGTVVAVERDGEAFVEFDAFELRTGDRLAVVGTDEELAELRAAAG